MRNGITYGLVLAAGLVALSGCRGRRYLAQVEDQASVHLQCPIQHVHAQRVGPTTWEVQACGAIVMYRCHRVPWVGMRCTRPRTGEVRPVVAAAPQPPPPSAQVSVTVAAAPPRYAAPRVVATPLEVLQVLGPAVRQCGARGVVVVRWSADGSVFTSLDGAEAGTAADACVRGLSGSIRVQAPGVDGTLVQEVW